jgi:hypothetical protein
MSVNIADKSVGIVLDISGKSKNDPNTLNISANSSDTIIQEVYTGGRSKGPTKKAAHHEQLMCAQSSRSSLPGGTLRKIILEETKKERLPENTFKIETIRSRIKRINLNDFNPSQQSPI